MKRKLIIIILNIFIFSCSEKKVESKNCFSNANYVILDKYIQNKIETEQLSYFKSNGYKLFLTEKNEIIIHKKSKLIGKIIKNKGAVSIIKYKPNNEKLTVEMNNLFCKLLSKIKLENDYSKSAELFAKDVLKENIRIHNFDLLSSKNPNHLKIFQSEGIESIVAYSNKKYPKNSEPINYQHFTLFVATFNSQDNAEKHFNQIKSDSKYGMLDNLKDLDEKTLTRVRSLRMGIKPGGLITQNGKQIFSLVETCRKTPTNESWLEYETRFLKFISNNKEEIEVLNSNCGKMTNYIIEKRKKPAGNTVYN